MTTQTVARTQNVQEALADVKGRAWMTRWLEAEAIGVLSDWHLPVDRHLLVQEAFERLLNRAMRPETPNLYTQWREAVRPIEDETERARRMVG